jgi:hypothetical protein
VNDRLQTGLAIFVLVALVGIPLWQALRKRKKPKPDIWGERHNPSGEVTGAVQGGFDTSTN